MESEGRTGVVLLNLGGPDSLEAVEPFLRNLFQDPEIFAILPLAKWYSKPLGAFIARKRAPKVLPKYAAMGGKSPLPEATARQARALEEALQLGPLKGARVYVAMRYWHPFTEEAVERIRQDSITRLIVLPLYPQYSFASTASSFQELDRVLASVFPGGSGPEIRKINDFHVDPGYISSVATTIIEAQPSLPVGEKAHLLFSAHSIPERYVKRGDPYPAQVDACIRAVVRAAGWTDSWSLAWQSKVGPVKWVGPQTAAEVARLGQEGVKNLVVVPISFVSDHIETLDELDVEVREIAVHSGVIHFIRTRALDADPRFIAALTRLVKEAAG